MTPTEEFRVLVENTCLATELPEVKVLVPVSVPIYRRRSLGWGACAISLCTFFCGLFGPLFEKPHMGFGFFFFLFVFGGGATPLMLFLLSPLTSWFRDTTWEITATRRHSVSKGAHCVYSAIREGGISERESGNIFDLLAGKKGVALEDVAEAFVNALQREDKGKLLLANSRLSANLEKHKIFQELDL